MNKKLTRLVSMTLAMVMIITTFTVGNGSVVLADDAIGEIAINDLNVEETPVDTTADEVSAGDTSTSKTNDTSVTDTEENPLFIDLGDVTNNEDFINLVANGTTINSSMTITRDENSSYVTVTGDRNKEGAWKIAKYNDGSHPGNIAFTLGKSATVTVTTGGEHLTYVSNELGDTSTANTIPENSTTGKFNLDAGTYYVYNTEGNITVESIVVAIDGSTEASYAAVSVTENEDGGTFSLDGEGGYTLNDNNPNVAANEGKFAVGGNYTLIVTPDTTNNYKVESVSANGATVGTSNVNEASGIYTVELSNFTESVNITINYSKAETTTITETTTETTTNTVESSTETTTTVVVDMELLTEGEYNANTILNSSNLFSVVKGDGNSSKDCKINNLGYVRFRVDDNAAVTVKYKCGSSSGNNKSATPVLNGQKGDTVKVGSSETSFTVSNLQGNTYDLTTETTDNSTLQIISITVTYSNVEPVTGTLNVELINPPSSASYTIKDSNNEEVIGNNNTYTLNDGEVYFIDVIGVQNYYNEVEYNSTDITNTGKFTYSKDVTSLKITYTEYEKATVTINVTSDDENFDINNVVPLIDGEKITASSVGNGVYNYIDYIGITHTISAPNISGYNKTITANAREISYFIVQNGLVINIDYSKEVISADDTWNFNNLTSITSNAENTLIGSNGGELIYKADKSDKVDGSKDISFETGIGNQTGVGIQTAGSGNTERRYFTIDIEPNATFTMYYVRNAKDTTAYISNIENIVLAKGNTLTATSQLGTVSYTNDTSKTMTIYCYGDDGKPIFIGATLLGSITSFGPIVVKVVDESGIAVTDATVQVGNATISSSANGEYTFTGPFTKAVKATVSKVGYVTTESEIFTATGTKTVVLKKVKAITVSGTVTDKDSGVALSNAIVTLTFTDGTSKAVATSTDGKFSFENVSNLKSITVSRNGYVSFYNNFTGNETTNQTVDAKLTKLNNTVTVKFYSTGNVSDNVYAGRTSSNITTSILTSKLKEYTVNNVEPGTKLYFKSTANNVFEWYPYENNGTKETILDSSYITFTQNSSKDKYFTYTVPENATAGNTYGVKFVVDNNLVNSLNTDDYNLNNNGGVGYGQYGLGDDKIRVNAGKGDQLTDSEIANYSKYNGRIYFKYAFIKPSLEDYSKGYSDKKYNGIVGTSYVQNANQYGILRGTFDTAPSDNLSSIDKPFVAFKPVITGLVDTDTVDVLIETSGGSYDLFPINDRNNPVTGAIQDPNNTGKKLYKLKNNLEYAIVATSSTKVYLKSVRMYDPNNIMANKDTAGVTSIGGSADPNFYVEDMGTVAELKNTTFGNTVLNGLSDVQSADSYKVFRIVSRIVVPSDGRDNLDGYLGGVQSVGYDVYETSTYNKLNDSSLYGYNAYQTVDSSLTDVAEEADAKADSAIEFIDTVNTAVMKLNKDDKEGYVNAGNIADLSSVTTDQLLCGNVKVAEANWYDLYVQTFIAVKSDTSLTLVPYTKVNDSKNYTVCDKDNNVAKVINTQTTASN